MGERAQNGVNVLALVDVHAPLLVSGIAARAGDRLVLVLPPADAAVTVVRRVRGHWQRVRWTPGLFLGSLAYMEGEGAVSLRSVGIMPPGPAVDFPEYRAQSLADIAGALPAIRARAVRESEREPLPVTPSGGGSAQAQQPHQRAPWGTGGLQHA